MKKVFCLSAFVLCAFLFSAKADNVNPQWSINFSNSKVFIENRGQFSLPENTGEKVLYAFDNGASMIYFTASGVSYSLKKIIAKKEESEKETAEEKSA